jgi:high frequency lysogenization protein
MSNNNHHRYYESNIALAGLCQAAALVKKIARSNEFDSQDLATSLNSIAITSSDNTEQIFGEIGRASCRERVFVHV